MTFQRLTAVIVILCLSHFAWADPIISAAVPTAKTPTPSTSSSAKPLVTAPAVVPAAVPAVVAGAVGPSYTDVQKLPGRVKEAEAHLCVSDAHSEKPPCDKDTKPKTGVASLLAAAAETRAQADIQRELAFYDAFQMIQPTEVATPETMKQRIEWITKRVDEYKKQIAQFETQVATYAGIKPLFLGTALPSPLPSIPAAALTDMRTKFDSRLKSATSSAASIRAELTQLRQRLAKAKPSQRKEIVEEIAEYEPFLKRQAISETQAKEDSACVVALSLPSCSAPVMARLQKTFADLAGEADSNLKMYKTEVGNQETQIESLKAQLALLEAAAAAKAQGSGAPTDAQRLADLELKYRAMSRATSSNSGWQTCGLSTGELEAIVYYTGSGYGSINSALRSGGEALAKYQPIIDELNSALSKLTKFDGYVVRGGALPEAVRAQHALGNVVTYAAFTSTSLTSGFSARDRFVIHSRTGRYIGSYSSSYSESEVLFSSNTKFKVIGVAKEGLYTTYTMDEVAP